MRAQNFNLFLVVSMVMYIASCINYQEAVKVSKKIPREYTGIDSLIRIDGYFYLEDIMGLSTPLVISNYGKLVYYPGGWIENHAQLQEYMKRANRLLKGGSYTLTGDTINAKWADRFGFMSYHIGSQKFVIVNDTTLMYIRKSSYNISDDIVERFYKFYEYKFD